MSTKKAIELLRNMANAADNIISSWEQGDLAGAVNILDADKESAKEFLAEMDQQRDHFHLVFAEVIFHTGKERDVSGTRVQVFTKAMDLQFPAGRLNFIQNAAAMQARTDIGNPKEFVVVGVNLLNITYLGTFTDSEFYAGIQKEETPTHSLATLNGENVVPLKPIN